MSTTKASTTKPRVRKPAAKKPAAKAPAAPVENKAAMNAELLEIDAANNIGMDINDLPDMPTSRQGFMGFTRTPGTEPRTFGTMATAGIALAALIVGLLIGALQAYPRGHNSGWQDGQKAAYLKTSIAAMQGYLQCMGEPPACEPQLKTARWAKDYTDAQLAELDAGEGE